MAGARRWSLELLLALYTISYIPSVALTKLLSTRPSADLGRPLGGVEQLPANLMISGVLTLAFVLLAGWWREAAGPGRRFPRPSGWMILSGMGTALVLVTVPLSFTFEGVSIPFIQLLMRGDILLIAPLVDLVAGRRVRWYSWVALLLVGAGLAVTIHQRGGLALPPLALATVLLYTLGYFLRLFVMTRIAKTGEAASARRYFVEEKLVALPVAILVLVGLTLATGGGQAAALSWGFVRVWTSPEIGTLAVLGLLSFVISVFSVLILLDKRENSYCVPMERSASILAGLAAAALLAGFYGLPAPSRAEYAGAALLVAAIVLLSVAPRLERRRVSPALAVARDADDPVHPAATQAR
ncbi:MAG: hypothetical protein PGN09_13125 [Sphingomonas fennica]